MKSIMRLDKSQFLATRIVSSTGTFFRDQYLMAGFKNVQIMIIGAAGGLSGASRINSDMGFGPAAGGGGGFLLINKPLSELPESCLMVAGVPGGDGKDGNPDKVYGESGGNGGDSIFGPWTAYGGQGATSGGAIVSGPTYRYNDPCLGGNGGTNSLNLGTFGQGGVSGSYIGASFNVYAPPTAPTSGTNQNNGAGIIGGCGGGGGYGLFRWAGAAKAVPVDGANGYDCAGADATAFSGGRGGGANSAFVTGGVGKYGGGAASNSGIVVVYVS